MKNPNLYQEWINARAAEYEEQEWNPSTEEMPIGADEGSVYDFNPRPIQPNIVNIQQQDIDDQEEII